MAGSISAIGAALTGGRVLSGAMSGAIHGLGKGLEFAGELEQKVQNAAGAGNAVAEIAGALQAGTPMAFIVNHVAADLSSALVKAAGNQGNQNAQSTLQRALASALAPPGTSPPGSSGGRQQAALLQQQLTNIVTRLAGQNAGQQSEFSGSVLDANSARETPAPQTKSTTGNASSVPDAVSSYVQSLLHAASASASGTSATLQSTADPSATLTNASLSASAASAQSQAQQTPLPDILTRMLTRAANADAQRNDEVVARAVPETAAGNAVQHVSGSDGNTGTAAIFDRLVAIIAEEQTASQNGSSGKDGSQDQSSSQNQSQNANSTPVSFAAQAANAPATANSQVQVVTAFSAAQHAVDPNAVIEQLVKGIAMRNSGSTSEVQLRLQPEHLGDVSLKLTVQGNTITANVVAQNADVRDMLLSNQQQLARSLAEAGLTLGKFSVNVSGGNAGFTQQQSQQQAQLGRSISAGGSLLSGEDASWEDQRFGPPLASGSTSLVFNYLA